MSNPRKHNWRVRIVRKVEDWIDIQAYGALEAESEARCRPGVSHVFPGMTLRDDETVIERPEGVRE